MIKKLYNLNFKSLLLIVIALFWIIAFFYLRFGLTRPQYNLIDIKQYISFEYFLIHLLFVLFHLGLLFYSIYIIFLKEERKSNKILNTLANIISFCITKPLEHLRHIIAPKIPYSGIIFCNFGAFLEKRNYKFFTKLFVVIFNFIPRILLSIIFFIELIFYNRIYYFIPSLFILLIPLLWNIFINLFKDFALQALKDIPTYIHVIPMGEVNANGFYKDYSFAPLETFVYEPNEVHEYSSLWFLAINIFCFCELYFISFQRKLTPYITIITSSLYLFAIIYKILYIFHHVLF